MSDKERLREWAEKLNALVTKYRVLSSGRPESRRIRRSKEGKIWTRFNTMSIRKDLVRGLGDLYEDAVRFGKNETYSRKEREKWSRLASYIAQTVNSIIESYDKIVIEETLDELMELVEKKV